MRADEFGWIDEFAHETTVTIITTFGADLR